MLCHAGTEACATAEPVFALRASKPFAKLLRSLCLLEATQFLCNFSAENDIHLAKEAKIAKSNVCLPLASQKGNVQSWGFELGKHRILAPPMVSGRILELPPTIDYSILVTFPADYWKIWKYPASWLESIWGVYVYGHHQILLCTANKEIQKRLNGSQKHVSASNSQSEGRNASLAFSPLGFQEGCAFWKSLIYMKFIFFFSGFDNFIFFLIIPPLGSLEPTLENIGNSRRTNFGKTTQALRTRAHNTYIANINHRSSNHFC